MNYGEFILDLLRRQENFKPITPEDHFRALRLIDAKVLGMDGFKYCEYRQAVENRRIALAQRSR